MDKKDKLAKQRRRLHLAIALATGVLIVLIVVLLVMNGRKDNLAGTWECENLIVEFNGQGEGVWIQDEEIQRFSYELRENGLTVDFQNPQAQDQTYTFWVEEDALVLAEESGNHIFLSRSK